MLRILKFYMVFVFLCLDDVFYLMWWTFLVLCISRPCSSLNDKKVVCKTHKKLFMAAVRRSSSSLHLKEYDFTKQVLNQIFYLVLFSCINHHLTAKFKTGKLIPNILFKNFNLLKILTCKSTGEYCFVVYNKEFE